MKDTEKYGNDHFWCFIENKWNQREVAIWVGNENVEPRILARANDKYDAKQIVDALLNYVHVEDTTKLGKKEQAFLEFVQTHCVEPYSTMATNAILWNDRETYNKLKSEFPVIYS